jgi:F0F1-type ATP synthase delta subunit
MEEIAQVYARSLFEVAREQDKIDPIREQLGTFADALHDDHDLQVFFFSPYFSTQEKEDGLDRAVSGADETFVNFLKLLIENHRMPVVFRVGNAVLDASVRNRLEQLRKQVAHAAV